MTELIQALQGANSTYLNVLVAIMRYVVPVLLAVLLFRCFKPLLFFRREPEIWAWLCMPDGSKKPITHWENVIGRAKHCDVVLELPTVSRVHGVLTRYDDGSWTITDSDSKGGILVNGEAVEISALGPEDVIDIGGIKMTLKPISHRQEQKLASLRTKASSAGYSVCNLLLLTVFQLLCSLGYIMSGKPETGLSILIGFGGIMFAQWALLLFYISIRRASFEVETIAFFLSSLGMAAIAAVVPEEAVKQLVAFAIGIVAFLIIGWSLRNLERAKVMRHLAAVAGIGFLAVTLVLGTEINGAKNWLILGPLSLQPSELSKVCFVFVGASAMDRLIKKRNIILFIAYSVLMCGCLALMNDFGTALIFFCAFLVVAYMRSGNVGTLALAITALAFAGVVIFKLAPHALRRFSSWRHIWEDPLGAGHQQTRALMCMASGGFLGLGAGRGLMHWYFAADSDMVTATICEEWGLIMGIYMILCILVLAIFCVRAGWMGRSSFYTIGSCTAATILTVQVILNALGTVDVIPLTGVTFPFASNGGSSMICAWGLMAFIKAADTRQNASFAVSLSQRGGHEDE